MKTVGIVCLLGAVAVAVTLLALTVRNVTHDHATTRRVRAMARARGWRFAGRDRSAAAGFAYPPFGMTASPRLHRVIRGQLDGRELLAFTATLGEGEADAEFGVVAVGLGAEAAPLRIVPPGARLDRWPRDPRADAPQLRIPAAAEGWTVLAPRRTTADAVQSRIIDLLEPHPGLCAGVDASMVVLVREHEGDLVLRIDELRPLVDALIAVLGEA